MSCPFRFRRTNKFSFGVAWEFVDFVTEREDRAEAEHNARYPTCWAKFLHWLGRR